MRCLAVTLVALAFAAPAGATLRPGDRATIDVAVATLWKAPDLARAIDRPSLTNPVDLDAWNRNLSTTESRVWLDAHVQTQALYAQTVTVLARSGGWAKVAVRDEPDPQDPHGYPGWLPVSQLRAGFDETGPSLTVVARTAVLRLTSGRPITLSYGTRLPIVRLASERTIVRSPDGVGTIAKAALAPSLHPSGASIVAQAKRFLGLHYLWGGLSAWGFDCSGLVWDVFRMHGLTIPRDADPQFHHGTAVTRAQLRAGDLLFWGSPSYADHVAIYAGNGLMVEAPDSAHSVRVVPVRWDRYYLGARRYLSG
ncbi:MAG TPA: C40 family peptidase [Gaiellaceae bacterium]|nr:C40 family peptidase [Gaiellaceae bacterium]